MEKGGREDEAESTRTRESEMRPNGRTVVMVGTGEGRAEKLKEPG